MSTKNATLTLEQYSASAEFRENIKGWVCASCQRYFGNEAGSQRAARFCCTHRSLCDCGQVSLEHYTVCQSCRTRNEADREADKIAKATVVAEANYTGPVYVDGLGREFFPDVGELIDHLACEHDSEWRKYIPAAIWACHEHHIVSGIYDQAISGLDDAAYEDWESDRLEGVKEFQAACAAFEKANKGEVSWEPDFTRRIVLSADREVEGV